MQSVAFRYRGSGHKPVKLRVLPSTTAREAVMAAGFPESTRVFDPRSKGRLMNFTDDVHLAAEQSGSRVFDVGTPADAG